MVDIATDGEAGVIAELPNTMVSYKNTEVEVPPGVDIFQESAILNFLWTMQDSR